MKLIEIGLKLSISSSTFASYSSVGVSGFGTIIVSIIFMLLSGFTAFVTLWFSAIAIRWEVVQKGGNTQVEEGIEMREKSDDQDDDKENNASPSCSAVRVIDCLKKRQPHVHAIFVLDIITFGGLIVVNAYIAAIQ